MAWRIGVDIGGTFTDVALVDDASGRIGVAKVPTTPGDLTTAKWMSERSGEKGVMTMTFNVGSGQSSGGQGSTSASDGLNYQQTKRPHLLPQELRT